MDKELWRESVITDGIQAIRSELMLGLWSSSALQELQDETIRRAKSILNEDGSELADPSPIVERLRGAIASAQEDAGSERPLENDARLLALDDAFLALESDGYGVAHCVPIGDNVPTDLFYADEAARGFTGLFFTRLSDAIERLDAPGVLPVYYASRHTYETPSQLEQMLNGSSPAFAKVKVSKRHLDNVASAKKALKSALRRSGLAAIGDGRWKHRLLVESFEWDADGAALRSGRRWLPSGRFASGPWGRNLKAHSWDSAIRKGIRTRGLKGYWTVPALPRSRRSEIADLVDSLMIPFLTGCLDSKDLELAARERAEESGVKIRKPDFDEVLRKLWERYMARPAGSRTGRCCEALTTGLKSLEAKGVFGLESCALSQSHALDEALMAAATAEIEASKRMLGVAFYHYQSIEDAIDTRVLRLNFASIDGDEKGASEVAPLIIDALTDVGLEPVWNGDPAKAIRIENFDWDRQLEPMHVA